MRLSQVQRYYRKIIHISAMDSPNVRYGLAQEKSGITPTDELLIPGVITYGEYKKRRQTWDNIRQRIGLDGLFWEGKESLMYPPQWLDRAERLALYLKGRTRIARGVGVDPGEGDAETAISIVDELGLIELISEKTPNTNRVIDMVLDVIHYWKIECKRVFFDRGGGGKQHADRLRANGYNVQTIGFGDAPSLEPKRGMTHHKERVDIKERKYAYFNRRSEMYGELRVLLDPCTLEDNFEANVQAYEELAKHKNRSVAELKGFAIPAEYQELRRQLAPIPLILDGEQRLKLPKKHKAHPKDTEVTLTDMIGCSPDQADSLVLAIHAMQQAHNVTIAGVL